MGFGEPWRGVPLQREGLARGQVGAAVCPKIAGSVELHEATAGAEHVAGVAAGCQGDFNEGVGAAGIQFRNFGGSCDSPNTRSASGACSAVP